MTPVEGKYVVLELFITDTFYPLLCGTDMTFHVQQEVVYKTGPNSGAWREKVTRLSEWNATVTGLTMVENAETLTFFWALQDSVRLKKQYIRMTFKDADNNGKQITGYAYITSNDINGPVGDFSTAQIVLEGTGAFSMGEIEPPVAEDFEYFSDYWQTVNGNNFISGASSGLSSSAVAHGSAFTLATTDTILEVDVEGVQFDVLASGTPSGRECVFDGSLGKITFPSDLIFDGTQRVFVEFIRTT